MSALRDGRFVKSLRNYSHHFARACALSVIASQSQHWYTYFVIL